MIPIKHRYPLKYKRIQCIHVEYSALIYGAITKETVVWK